MRSLVLDTNIVFAALLFKNSTLRDKLSYKSFRFYSPKFLLVEIFKHKERILKKSNGSEDDVLEFLSIILHHINFINEDSIPTSIYLKAHFLCKDIDEKDTPFIAIAIGLDCPLWTRDEELKKGLKAKGYNNFFNEDEIGQ